MYIIVKAPAVARSVSYRAFASHVERCVLEYSKAISLHFCGYRKTPNEQTQQHIYFTFFQSGFVEIQCVKDLLSYNVHFLISMLTSTQSKILFGFRQRITYDIFFSHQLNVFMQVSLIYHSWFSSVK